MARPLRLQYPGALYHVISRGNYRAAIFSEKGAKDAFIECVFTACEKAGWKLHGYVVMANHYHLALETPAGNLSEGMRWLQSTFANRFNRYRKENGHVFQGRYKALVVEDLLGLGAVTHYIHLNPVRAKLLPVEQLVQYQESSYWMLEHPKKRPGCLEVETCLNAAGDLADTAAGRRKYAEYLAWLEENEEARKQLKFEKMSKGWALGGAAFKKALAKDHQALLTRGNESIGRESREALELIWTDLCELCMSVLRKKSFDLRTDAKSEDWKIAIAAHLKATTTVNNPWLAEKLEMGVPAGVSRYVGELEKGKRPAAYGLLQKIAKIKV